MRRKLLWVALLYFAEGMPFGLVLDNFPVYFRVHGVSLAAIGFLSLLRAPWWAKVFWSPLVDQVGERRQWIAAALAAMAGALLLVQALPPAPVGTALIATLFAFTIAAATQDVAIDAYTIELLVPGEDGIANGLRVAAYRAALIGGGGGGVGCRCARRRCRDVARGDLPESLAPRTPPGGFQPRLCDGRLDGRRPSRHLRRVARRELHRRARHGRVSRLPDERLRQAAGRHAVRAALGALQPERLARGRALRCGGRAARLRRLL